MSRGAGLNWFPLDTVLDTKIQLIEAEFGLKGFAVIVKLFQLIYGEQGYYCEFTEEVQLLFSKNNQLGYDFVSELIAASVRRGIFDADLYNRYRVLTSKGIQKNYARVANRRVQTDIKAEYLLVSDTVFSKSVNINRDSASRNDVSDGRTEHSTVEDSIVQYSIGDNNLATVAKFYEDNIGSINSIIAQKLSSWVEDVDVSLIEYAIEQAVKSNAKNLNYIEAVLNNHLNAGRKTRADAENHKPKKKTGNKFLNFEQPSEDTAHIEEILIKKRMKEQGII